MDKMKKFNKETWAIIPARGGSKTIPMKNMVDLNGKPLIEYVIRTARSCGCLQRILCSTENKTILSYCLTRGIEVHKRPIELAGDQIHIADVLVDLLENMEGKENRLPQFVALLQPTSPFVLPDHIQACISKLNQNKKANSAQTITTFPHNFHAYNQRVVKEGYVHFRFPRHRKKDWNKQKKPRFYAFGNVVVTKTIALLRTRDVFAIPSIPHNIPFHYALDVDGPDDLVSAEIMIQNGFVQLPQ